MLAERWPGLTKIAIDHAIAEPVAEAGGVAVVPGTFDWDDVGDFASLGALLGWPPTPPASRAGMRVLGSPPDVLAVDSTGLVAAGSGRLVALLGVEDLVVVDTPDAVLVVPRERAQDVKALVDRLAERGRSAPARS